LHAAIEDQGLKRSARSSGRRHHLVAAGHLGLEEGGLVQEGVAVDIVAGHFDGDQIGAGPELLAEVPDVDAIIAVGAAGRAEAHELAVDPGPIDGGRGHPQRGLRAGLGLDHGAEADREVHFLLAAGRPNGPGAVEVRFVGAGGSAPQGADRDWEQQRRT
jgi:hypothetical protein